jgi:hypothetical protein
MTLLESVFNHVALPPKLPGQRDVDIEDVEVNILTRLIDACRTLGALSGEELAGTWLTVGNSLRVCRDLNSGRLERATLLREFHELDRNLLILHVTQQNAALFVRRQRR